MIAEDAAFFIPAALGGVHFLQRGFRGAVYPRNKALRFYGVFRIVQRVGEVGLVLVQHIVDTPYHSAPDRDNLVIGHLQRLLNQPPRLAD